MLHSKKNNQYFGKLFEQLLCDSSIENPYPDRISKEEFAIVKKDAIDARNYLPSGGRYSWIGDRYNDRGDIIQDGNVYWEIKYTSGSNGTWYNTSVYILDKQSLSVIDKPWEICLYRQGYYDYNTFFFQKDKAEIFKEMTNKPKKQFFFIQPTDKKIFDFLLTLDYNNLAARNTVTPGFGKGDFVSFYIENLEKENIQER